ncbi:ABC transporter ATP-binding protein [Nakamurella sp. GG22]
MPADDVFETHSATADPGPRDAILRVRDLGVEFRIEDTWAMASEGVSFDINHGEVLAVVGESGSGKSVSAMSILGLLPPNARIKGSATLQGKELIGAREATLRAVRGKDVGLIFQEPMTALNPVLTVGFQVNEVLLSHFDMTPQAAQERVLELMRLVDLPDPEGRYNLYPHQLSGGQRQRIMIAMALACDPVLLIADEPTTALDVTVQAEILDLLRDLHHRLDSAILLITHDMGVVADLADRVVVMREGHIVETGSAAEVFGNPQEHYTQDLLAAVPHLGTEAAPRVIEEELVTPPGTPALEVVDLVLEYPGRGRVPAFRAVDKVSFAIPQGEVLGLVGESGSGKSTIGRAVASLLPITEGSINIGGTDIKGMSQRDLMPMRRKVAIVFQDPASSLNPRMTIGESIGEPLFLHEKLRKAELAGRVEGLLDSVRLRKDYRYRYPHELSGGQRQRVGIARALSLGPDLLVADEPTSALDVSVQAHVLDLFKDLQAEYGFACLFISHDLAVVEILAKQIAVLHRGMLAEIGTREQILRSPQDPYTKRLLAAAPVPDPAEQQIRREDRRAMLAAGVISAAEDAASPDAPAPDPAQKLKDGTATGPLRQG